MRIMIASDIHGSLYYLKQMISCYEKENPDKLLLLGDILYHGPRNDLPRDYDPKAVIKILNDMKEEILCVRGNCDTEVDQMVLSFPILADYAILYYENKMIFATHGHVFNINNKPMLKEGDVLLHGHTHVPALVKCDNFHYLNPGSISIPKENSKHSYMMFEDGTFTWKDLSMNPYKTWNI